MKKYYCYSVLIIMIMSMVSCGNLPSQEELAAMSLDERWEYLEEGQSLEDVHHLLGTPVRTVQNGNIYLDQYDCALCLTKTDKHNGLLAWNAPVKGFEEEVQLFYIGEAPSDFPNNMVKGFSSLFSEKKAGINRQTPTKEEIGQAFEDIFKNIEDFREGRGKELLEALQENSEQGFEELERFLREDIGENAEELLQLQQELLQQGWEEHGEEAVEFLEKLTQRLKELEAKDLTTKTEDTSTTIGPTSTRAEQWAAIKNGMTEAEVIAILGTPKSKKHWSGNINYQYECFGCKVVFNERGKVWAWNSPEL